MALEKSDVSNNVEPLPSVGRFERVFRGTFVQVIIVGLVSFTNPGIWNALNSTYNITPRLFSSDIHELTRGS